MPFTRGQLLQLYCQYPILFLILFVCASGLYFQVIYASTYYGTWWMGGDRENEGPGNARIIYTYPDKVEPGKKFNIGITLEYLKDKSARSSWIVFSNVSVNMRSLPTPPGEPNMHDLVVNTTHKTSGLIKAGEQYSQSFSLIAPTLPGYYMPVLTFNAFFGPGAGAVGLFQFDTGIYYNQTNREHGIILPAGFQEAPPILVENGSYKERILSIEFESPITEMTPLNLTVDNRNFPVVNKFSLSFPNNTSHFIKVPYKIDLVKDTNQSNYVVRALFVKWSDGVDSNSRTVIMDRNIELFARYKIQYYLSVGSTLGNLTLYDGSKWYDGGDEARFSVNPSIGFFSIHSFDRWIGDISGEINGPMGDVIMNGPKKVIALWKFDFGYLGAVIGIVTGILTLYGKTRDMSLKRFFSALRSPWVWKKNKVS